MGFDAHRFDDEPPVILGGVVVDSRRGVAATSDGDVAAHAVADAVLGAVRLGDLGEHFPSSDPRWENASSVDILSRVAEMASGEGCRISYVDVTIVAERVRVSPHRGPIAAGLAAACGIGVDRVSVKATSTDGLGFLGRDEGIAAVAVVTVQAPSYDVSE